MYTHTMFLLELMWISAVYGKDPPYYETNALVNEDGRPIHGGDMVLTTQLTDVVNKTVDERGSNNLLEHIWPNGQIPFKISPELERARENIYVSIGMWNDETCVHFYEDNNVSSTDYHLIIKKTGTGCNSPVGLDNSTYEHKMSLDDGCHNSVRIIVHELGHALGLNHEQDHADRGSYLTVYKENMNPARRDDIQTEEELLYGLPYDYFSIMQYSAYAFSINGRLTYVPKDPLAEAVMGNAVGPSFRDYQLVNLMYNCTAKCQQVHCFNDGYASWNRENSCKCFCPPGFSGAFCEKNGTLDSACLYTITSPTVIMTPNYPNDMPTNIHCAWLIKGPDDQMIQVEFYTFHLLRRYKAKCPWDMFRIRKGDLESDDPGKVYCGKELESVTIAAKQEMLLLLSTSEYSDHNTGFFAFISFLYDIVP